MTEQEIRKRAKFAVEHPWLGCGVVDHVIGFSEMKCANCGYGCINQCYGDGNVGGSVIAAQHWLDTHPENSQYIIERPKGMPDWVQIGIKCRFSEGFGGPDRNGYLAGFDGTDEEYRYRDEVGRWYKHAEPILATENKPPRADEMVAYWDDSEERYGVIAAQDIDMDLHDHVTSYHGQLDPSIEALKDEEVYK